MNVTRKAAIREVMRMHHLDKQTASALVDAAISAEQQTMAAKPFLKDTYANGCPILPEK